MTTIEQFSNRLSASAILSREEKSSVKGGTINHDTTDYSISLIQKILIFLKKIGILKGK